MVQIQNGAPKTKTIDWNVVDRFLEAGCPGSEIAPYFGIHPETLYDRAYKEFGIMWTDYSQQKKQKGNIPIRVKQYDKALKGDNNMLIWLGKNRLKQRDAPSEDLSAEDTKIENIIDLAKLRAENSELRRMLNESKAGTEHLSSEQET